MNKKKKQKKNDKPTKQNNEIVEGTKVKIIDTDQDYSYLRNRTGTVVPIYKDIREEQILYKARKQGIGYNKMLKKIDKNPKLYKKNEWVGLKLDIEKSGCPVGGAINIKKNCLEIIKSN